MVRFVKYLSFFLALCITLAAFAGCKRTELPQPPDPEENARMLEFPGTHWGDTPEEVKRELNLPQEELTEDSRAPQPDVMSDVATYAILWEPAQSQLFGQKPLNVLFHFFDYQAQTVEEADFRLTRVEVYYPEDADMAGVRQSMVDYYGPESGDATSLANSFYVMDQADRDAIKAGKGSDLVGAWVSTNLVRDCLPAEELTTMEENIRAFLETYTGERALTMDSILGVPAAGINFFTCAWGDDLPEGMSRNHIIFAGTSVPSIRNQFLILPSD